ncbi:MAG: head-tail adaptor protein [Massilia sp.]
MVAPFKCDDKVSIEHDIGGRDPDYGTPVQNWVPLLSRYWANVQDVLPSRAESADGGIERAVLRARLRMQGAGAVTGQMRAVLHGRADMVMKIIAGPALLNDRVHYEFQLEAYSNG